RRGGHGRVSSGSTRAAAASQLQSRKLFFTLVSSSVNTALGVISAPAPAVVGTPTHGKGRGGSGAWPLKCRATGCSEKNKPAAALAVSSALPPPTPTMTSAPCSRANARASSTPATVGSPAGVKNRSEEHTSELQSR